MVLYGHDVHLLRRVVDHRLHPLKMTAAHCERGHRRRRVAGRFSRNSLLTGRSSHWLMRYLQCRGCV